MGEGSVITPARLKPPSWKLVRPHDKLTQGVVVSGFSALPSAQALFLCCEWPENGPTGPHADGKGAWLKTLYSIAPITDADGRERRAASLAFTWTGLQKIGLSQDVLATFSAPFREGMYQEDRLRRLGDKVDDKWQETVIKGGPQWSGNTPVRENIEEEKQIWERTLSDVGRPEDVEEHQVRTPNTVHALLVLYEKTDKAVQEWADKVSKALDAQNVRTVHQLPLDLRLAKGIGREHFGFADGLSQPIPYDATHQKPDPSDVVVMSDGSSAKEDQWHGVPLGEILLGHINGHHEKAPGPMIAEVAGDTRPRDAELPTDGAPEGFYNLGLDGSYLVVRELRQDVAAFWTSMKANAVRIRAHDPTATHVTADWLAERVIGRNRDGHLLCPKGFLEPDKYQLPQNAFGFRHADADGVGCPPGSHVRRSNPRDSLAKDLASAQTLLHAANNHRILRRGRKYGTTIGDPEKDDGQDRGLLFMCLNTDIARQFEFVQQTWLLNKNFHTLYDETDPLVGPKGQFTIREQPLRRILEVETFIKMAGGEYFFLPSMPALNYLASL
jgi:Dyp-type peroxidase family